MTSFHVDVPALESAASAISTTIDSLHTDIARLTAQLRGLESSWSGPAATAFGSVVDEWGVSSGRVTESLTSIGRALNTIHAHYLETETMNVRLLGQ